MMNIRPFQIKVVIIFFASYCIWLIKWWFFFPTWDLHLQMNFINFLPLIILILIILFFSNLAALAFDQWCICDDFGTFANQFCCDHVLLGFFGGSIKDFFLSTYANIFLWHHTLNQHIHIDPMYPSSITHFNTMIFIPLCENCKLCTYWYHLVWVFTFSPQYLYCHGIWISKKSKTHMRWTC